MPPERLGDLAGFLGAFGRVLLEAAQDDVLELLADLGPEGARRLRDLVDDPIQDRLHFAREGRLADEALIEDDAHRIDVRAPVEGARGDLFRREVGDGADEGPGLGQARFGHRVREAEVHDPHPGPRTLLPRDHDVGGLDVAVDDASGMAVVQSLRDLDTDVHDLPEAQRLVPDQAQQVGSACDRHHEEERPLVAPDVVDGHDGGMVHLGHHLGFALESLFELRGQVRRGNELHGDLAVQERVAGAVHNAHSAAAELPEDLVAVGKLGRSGWRVSC